MATDPRLARLNPPTTTATPPPPPPPPTEAVPEQKSMGGLDGTQDENSRDGETRKEDGGFKLKFCTVCASNNNRSMEAHLRLSLSTYPVLSFGTGSLVRLPGPSITQPNVYPFNSTSYASIIGSLSAKDPRLYRANGVLAMLERNRAVKWGPERWQDWAVGHPRTDALRQADKGAAGVEAGVVDVVFTCEERCWDAVVENLLERGSPLNRPVHVVNVDIKDNHEEALVGGRAILELADALNGVAREERERGGVGGGEGWCGTGFDERVPEVVAEWQGRWPHLPALWTLGWF